MMQFQDLKVMRPEPQSSLSPRDRQDALNYLTFLKKKLAELEKGSDRANAE